MRNKSLQDIADQDIDRVIEKQEEVSKQIQKRLLKVKMLRMELKLANLERKTKYGEEARRMYDSLKSSVEARVI